MTILLLTSTGRRHIRFAARLAARLADGFDALFVVGQFLPPVSWPLAYGRRVWEAERRAFPTGDGDIGNLFCGTDYTDDINAVTDTDYDLIVVFGCSLIREPLLSALMGRRAVNLHAGISPFYRGTACNFWAAYDGHPEYVGATIHRLSAGIDAGDILETVQAPEEPDPFLRGMLAVRAGQDRLIEKIQDGSIWDAGIPQDLSQTIRYSKRADFTDAVALEFLNRNPRL